MSFTRKKIDLEFHLGRGDTFDEGGFDTVRVSGHRVSASFASVSSPSALPVAQIQIFGLGPSIMNKLSMLNLTSDRSRQNEVIVRAGDDTVGMPIVFSGTIRLAQIGMEAAPDPVLNVYALTAGWAAMKPVDPTSYTGYTDVEIILGDIAQEMGLKGGCINYGVNVKIARPSLNGSSRDKILSVVQAADIEFAYEPTAIVIWPKGASRLETEIILNKDTGLVGWPTYGSGDFIGIACTSLFNPMIRLGCPVRVESDLKVANGKWSPYEITHHLESEVAGGQWFTKFQSIKL